MPKKGPNRKCLMRVKGRYSGIYCTFCQKTLTNKEVELHLYVCEKYHKKMFNYGYYFKTPLGGSSVSTGMTNNSSLTNPFFGAFLPLPSDK